MIEWHRLLGLALTDYFEGTSYSVELEKDLSVKRQFVDVIIIEHQKDDQCLSLPDGLDNLGKHNLLTYKSHQESLDAWTLDELLGHYVNYRKQISPTMTKLLPVDDFRLYGVSTRYPQNLERLITLTPIQDGIYDIRWGSQTIRLIVLSQISQGEKNAIWHMFSAIPERVRYGMLHYQWHIPDLSTVIHELFQHYQLEGVLMSYTVNDYYRDFTRSHLDWLTPEERVRGLDATDLLNASGIDPKALLKRVPPDDLLQFLLSDDIAEQVSLEKFEQFLQQLRRKKRHE